MVVAQTPQHLQEVGNDILVYITALSAILFWDCVSNLNNEYRLIWRHVFTAKARRLAFDRRSCNLFFYLIVRYLCVIQFAIIQWAIHTVWHNLPRDCPKFFQFDSQMSAVVVWAAAGIFALRVSAIYSQNRRVDIFLLVLWLVQGGGLFWSASNVVMQPGISFCLAAQRNPNLLALWLSPSIFDAIILALTVRRALQVRKEMGHQGSVLTVLVRDGTLYFVGCLMVNLVTVGFDIQRIDDALRPVNAAGSTIMTSLLVTRVSLSLRHLEVAHRPYQGGSGGQQGSGGGGGLGTASGGSGADGKKTTPSRVSRWSSVPQNFTMYVADGLRPHTSPKDGVYDVERHATFSELGAQRTLSNDLTGHYVIARHPANGNVAWQQHNHFEVGDPSVLATVHGQCSNSTLSTTFPTIPLQSVEQFDKKGTVSCP